MRVLFTSPAAIGHFHPLVPVAQAARDAGHEVTFAMPPSFRGTVERVGFRWLPSGLDTSAPEYARLAEERNRLPGLERARFMARYGFAGLLARQTASDLLRACDAWRPDVLVRDMSEYGGCVAADVLGIPHVAHESLGYRASRIVDITEPLATLRAAHRLTPDPEMQMLERYLVLSPFPPTLDGSREMVRPTLRRYRTVPFDRSGNEAAPEWPLMLPDAPLVYATLGTANNLRTDILRPFVEALRDEHVNLVVTVGRDGNPDQFGPQPPNVRIERYVPQSLLFPRCDLVISHGGSGTVIAALAHGIPQVITPITADQPQNADRCAEAGAARVVQVADVTAASIREAALSVLADPSYRSAAQRIRDEMAALPGTDQAVALLERLARDKVGIIASR